jgi:hypothetical protein
LDEGESDFVRRHAEMRMRHATPERSVVV